ncbi:MAG: FHA domain-containing protein [Planctomycetota bacterium]|nr:FHA domain-containing protein [Planctomycetota bacterium]
MALPAADLVITGPDGVATKFRLGDKAVIGRHPECEIVLGDPMLSRRHCKIERSPTGTFVLEDMRSANGTILNGEPLRPSAPVPLHSGDTIQIGETTLQLVLDLPAKSERSAVKLDDEEVALSFVRNAAAPAVSEEEIVSQDVTTLQRVAERLKLLVEVGQALGTSLELPKLLSTCLEKLFEVFPQADRGVILLYGPDGSMPHMLTPESDIGSALAQRKAAIAMSRTRTTGSTMQGEFKFSKTVYNQVKSQHKSVLMEKSGSMSLIDISSVMCAPLLAGETDLGLLYIETRKVQQVFREDDVNVMTAVAGQIAIAIRNSDLVREAAAQAAQRENLSRFLSPQLVEQMLKGNLSDKLGGTEKKGTVFFSDIVGFTKLANKMSAVNVVTLLNRYFKVMQDIIFRRGGSIDKCAGDNIMAHWGVLGDAPQFTACAVTAAVEMQIALFMFNRDEVHKKEIVLPATPLGHGIGLNTGIVCAGNIGSEQKIEFTVIGEAVNLSSRLESIAGREQTFVGAACWEEIKDTAFCVRMPDCPLKNVEKPMPVYSVRGIMPQSADPAAGPTIEPNDRQIDDLLFCLPCVLHGADFKVEGVVTRIMRAGGDTTRFLLQLERPVPVATSVTLAWSVPEKLSLPRVQGDVEKCWQHPKAPAQAAIGDVKPITPDMMGGAGPRGGTAVLNTSVIPGSLVLSVKNLPPEIAAWRPGTLLQSDMKSPEEIVRA